MTRKISQNSQVRINARRKLFERINMFVPKTPPTKKEGDRLVRLFVFIEEGKAPRYELRKKIESGFIEPKDGCCRIRFGNLNHIDHSLKKNPRCGSCEREFIQTVIWSGEDYPFTEACHRGFNLGDKVLPVHYMSKERYSQVMHEFDTIGHPLWIEGEKTDDGFTVWMLHNKKFRITRPTEFEARKALHDLVWPFFNDESRSTVKKLDRLVRDGKFKDTGKDFRGNSV